MSNMVTIKNGEHLYIVPIHEFSRYWVEHLDYIQIPHLPNNIPAVSRMAALKRGSGIHAGSLK